MAKRVSLTKGQIESAAGTQLLLLCKSITADGEVSKDEIIALTKWLRINQGAGDDIPGVKYLVKIVARIIADKRITKEELAELHEAIEKVLPPDDRKIAVAARKPESFCPYCVGPFEKRRKVGGKCPHCGMRYHVADGMILTAGQYEKLEEQRAVEREAARRGGRLDAPSANKLALMIRVGLPIPVGCTDEQASRLLDRANIDDAPTDEEYEQYLKIRDGILARIRGGESIDSVIARPPSVIARQRAAESATAGCLSAILIAAVFSVLTCLLA